MLTLYVAVRLSVSLIKNVVYVAPSAGLTHPVSCLSAVQSNKAMKMQK